MHSLRQIKQAEKAVMRQQEAISDLESLAAEIERCESTVGDLNSELQSINTRFQPPRTTQQDIDYLSALLECAKKKLRWEKRLANLQKSTPELLQKITAVMQDRENPPREEVRAAMMRVLHGIQGAMERLQKVAG